MKSPLMLKKIPFCMTILHPMRIPSERLDPGAIPSEAPPKGLKWRCGATGRRCVHWRIAKTFDVEDALPIS